MSAADVTVKSSLIRMVISPDTAMAVGEHGATRQGSTPVSIRESEETTHGESSGTP